jgi:transcriptional regulator with XRE-family HTH domain
LKTKIEQHAIDAVKAKRLKERMSQATLAYCLNVSRGFIGDVENPKMRAKYNLNHLNELAKLFGCSPRDFLPDSFLEEDAP